ncbi:SIR2 family protein [Bradyrhizobium sp. HKCCYLRH3099]|uniref:tetratricopeptide repeat protein n=1 Tax=unclassified Bradyrhizobium TaxID=2631580 RepID=UPI003EBCA2B4
MNVLEEDANYLLQSLKAGEVVLVLGAGASADCKNTQGQKVKQSRALAETIANRAGLPYNNEDLSVVLTAVKGGILSAQQINLILTKEYQGIEPSSDLEDLFAFAWRRLYTWNIDDAILNLRARKAQSLRFYNGMNDKAADLEGHNQLHVVYLHGEIAKPEHGFILSEAEYWTALKSEKHFWYQRAAQDYFAFCPVFVGSTLKEPILAAELERVKKDSASIAGGKAFLITPDELSPIQRGAFKARGIVHIQATLGDFVRWLKTQLNGGWTAKDVVKFASRFDDRILDALTRDDLAIAQSLRPIDPVDLRARANALDSSDKAHLARQFLRGFPPSWLIAASDIPVHLEGIAALERELAAAIDRGDKLFLVSGQSGSGKTTATMIALLKYLEKSTNVDLYELSGDARSPKRAFSLLRRISTKKAIVYIEDMFVFADILREDLESASREHIFVVSTARSSEWSDRLVRYFRDIKPFFFQRFTPRDFDPLIERLVEYVPAPKFRRLTLKQQREKLKKSDSQLLIALREATESDHFTDMITNEFEKLPDNDTKVLLLIIGLGTIARVGISREATRDAYNVLAVSRTFEDALNALEGIVAIAQDRRFYARHELYVRHIVENVVSFSDFLVAIQAILRTYLKYEIPIVRSVSRLDGYLFRFILNHDFIYQHASRHRDFEQGRLIYSAFEVSFQLDGHFWLQYGLYLAEADRLDDALDMLRRSVQAYPDNIFAVHALADVQLRVARAKPRFDSVTKELVDQAVKSLKLQDAQQRIDLDVYPAVTLANGHLSVLIRHNELSKARSLASEYFERLQQLDKKIDSPAIRTMKEKVFRFATLGE